MHRKLSNGEPTHRRTGEIKSESLKNYHPTRALIECMTNINPIREHLRTSKARRKSLNADWWTENNQANKLRAEIRRIHESMLRLELIQRELSERESRMSKMTADIKTEDDFQAELKSKLSEIAFAKALLRRFEPKDDRDPNSLIPGIPNSQLLIRREGEKHGA